MAGADLSELLGALDADASLVQRHIWLIALFQWIRGDGRSAAAAAGRVDILLDVVDVRPQLAEHLRAWWQVLLDTVDEATLLSDYGFASRNAFISELMERLHRKLLPATPETVDAAELFSLVLPSPVDALWIEALSPATLERLAALLTAPAVGQPEHAPRALTQWQASLIEGITFCTSHIRAVGFSPEIRVRMSTPARASSPFHTLGADFEALRDAWWATLQDPQVNPQVDTQADPALHEAALARLNDATVQFKAKLEACRQAAASVYTHLDAHGISMDLVFRLRQLRARVLRIRALLDCLVSDTPLTHSAKLIANLARVGQEQRSLGALVSSNTSLLAAKVAERSSETGEHYITRNRAEYRAMLGHAAGGGALTAGTTALKFAIMAVGLSAFWTGFWSGVMYAASFVLIQLLHFTLATKQPAMTAPAMAAKLKDISDPLAVESFVDEVTHLVRSQFAAVLGNVVVVFPVALALSAVMQAALGRPMIDAATANYVLHSLSLLGPCLLFAAFTGVLLFSSSIVAGWVENWFVLHRLDSAIRYNPAITRALGTARANRWAHFMRQNISGLAANISLGFMLGLVPAVLAFLAVGLDVRHVTLSAGQLGAACASLGWDVVYAPALWWAVASIPLIGVLNVGVSFYLAFRVALTAHNVSGLDRTHIRHAIWQRLRRAPGSFFWPAPEPQLLPKPEDA
ncbi:MAG: recombinase [Burkholderiales bacterium PBB3]|nr:MAG: recombinase [Burkholderiales bacterium PBB3]